MNRRLGWLLLLALLVAVVGVACGGASSSPQDLVPKTGLPSGMVFSASSEETVPDSPPSRLGHTPPTVMKENVGSISLAKYRHSGSADDYYVLIVKCKDEAGAEKVLEAYSSVTFGENRFEVNEVSFNGHDAAEGYAALTSDYVYFWRNKEFVFGVVGSSRELTLGLAKVTGM